MTIQAIPTHYANHKFKSRTEARWAVFFDSMKIRWEYEPEGVVLPDGTWYLCDFWLPDLKVWAEVKPEEITDAEWTKAEELHRVSDFSVLMLNGAPWPKWYGATDHRGPNEGDVCGDYPWPNRQHFCWGKNIIWWGFGDEWEDLEGTIPSEPIVREDWEDAMAYARAFDFLAQ